MNILQHIGASPISLLDKIVYEALFALKGIISVHYLHSDWVT